MPHSKEWSPKKYPASELRDVFVSSLTENIDSQRSLTKYTGDDEGFRNYVANKSWDPYTYKLIGEITGSLLTVLYLAADLDVQLPMDLARKAELYGYVW